MTTALIVAGSIIGSLALLVLLGVFVWWVVGRFGSDYDAGDSLEKYRNPETGRLRIPLSEVVWSDDGT